MPVLKHPNVDKISDLQLPIVGDDRRGRAAKTIIEDQRTLESESRWLKGPLSDIGSRKGAVREYLHVCSVCLQLQSLETVWTFSGVASRNVRGCRLLARKRRASQCN